MTAILDRDDVQQGDERIDAEVVQTQGRRGEIRRTVGLTFLTIGLCLILFVVYVFGFTSLQQQRKQRQLLNVYTSTAGAALYTGSTPHDGLPVGVLHIPALNLDQVVVQGTSPSDLAAGPGAMPNTSVLGTKGNAVIAGRSYTASAPFGQLRQLKASDQINVVTALGSFKYRVVGSAKVAVPGQVNPASPTKVAELTLLTSQSLTGGGTLYVKALLVSAPAAASRAKVPPTTTQLGVAGDPSATIPAIIWGALLVLVLAASIIAYRQSGRRIVVVYLLSTPIVLAVALMFYSQLYQLMPSTI